VEDGETEKESKFEITAGVSRKINQQWSVGIEALHSRAYPNHSLSDEEYSATYLGPNLHFVKNRWWLTLTIMPQIYGDGDGSSNNLQLSHRERIETRLVAGVNF
jgi:hypothetical protein